MSDEIKDIVVPILQNIQREISVLKSDMGVLKENTHKMDQRLKSVEAHMSGFMASTCYLETEIGTLENTEKTIN